MKRILSLFLVIIIWFVSINNSYASEINKANQIVSLDQYINMHSNSDTLKIKTSILKDENASVSLLSTLSTQKTQTKNIISSTDGSILGKVTLTYKTWIVNGRPQFAYDHCYISEEFYTYWDVNPYLTFTVSAQ